MKCAWFFIATFLFNACFTNATEKKCNEVRFGNGKYDVKNECWEKEPTKPNLAVRSDCQSLTIRRKILRALKCRPGIKKFLDQKSLDCEPSKVSDIGLTNVCPHKFEYVTRVARNSKSCYVVFPHRQCVTYAKCENKRGCSKNASVTSACLPDRHRFFNVWLFCPDDHRFELETLELPQCCTCREYKLCAAESAEAQR
ncbi:uncharacterized protein LOC133192312 [Saccostrea echinata]|uniref:uncharacterized protein LOC133192312 n=1 Tax=Saccostrea echinata TaxID=191078 RepID=UPI002A7EE151|nr:uncharacterized protein LOC133192312 [Saccostrea echinata]